MRCKECNIDLSETYTRCPLCGSEAVNQEPRLKGIKNAPYCKKPPQAQKQQSKRPHYGLSAERLKAFFNT